jgi:hypothetical protein
MQDNVGSQRRYSLPGQNKYMQPKIGNVFKFFREREIIHSLLSDNNGDRRYFLMHPIIFWLTRGYT